VNVWQGPEAVAIAAELPGIEPGDIEISVKDNVLTLSGERKAPEVPDGARWHRNERGFGRFSRTIRLPFAASTWPNSVSSPRSGPSIAATNTPARS